MVAESLLNELGEVPTVEPVDTEAGPSTRQEHVSDDDISPSAARADAREQRLGIALERISDTETTLETIGTSLQDFRQTYDAKFEELKAMLSDIQDKVVQPSSSTLVASVSPSQPQFHMSGQPSRNGGGLALSIKEVLATIDTFYGGDK
jgi:hypothetical protein